MNAVIANSDLEPVLTRLIGVLVAPGKKRRGHWAPPSQERGETDTEGSRRIGPQNMQRRHRKAYESLHPSAARIGTGRNLPLTPMWFPVAVEAHWERL
jgi:hypothetical protein